MALTSRNFYHDPDVEVQNPVQLVDTHSDQSIVDQHSSVHRPTAPSLSLFPNAQNFEVNGGQFNAISGNVTINNNTSDNDLVSTVLWPHVAAVAIFDSAARHAAGKCHPGTREKIIKRILDWIKNPDPTKHMLWLHGSAGAGKSALEHTICERLKDDYPDERAASFFFSGGSPDRGNALKLFTTLAYQLAIQFPSMREEINHVLRLDPSLPTKSMETQFDSLIVQPLRRCHDRAPLSRHPVLIIDGLDECGDDEGLDTQRNIVALIAKSIVDHNLPLRCMIASRPEYWIREAFEAEPLGSITTPLSLREDVDADNDIKNYLTNEFENIRLKNERIMSSVALPWPSALVIWQFAREASGHYLYAKTVLKFVEGNYSKHSNPQKQLQILTSPGPHRATAYSDLDRLYATIMSACPELKTIKRVLAALLLEANLTIIRDVLGVDPDELVLVLDALCSLIEKTKRKLEGNELKREQFLESIFGSLEDPGAMSFCHRSFREFLTDETRSGPFYIDLKSDAAPNDIVMGYFDMIHWNLDQHYTTEPHKYFTEQAFVTYHGAMQMTTYASFQFCSLDLLFSHMTRLTAKLDLYDFGRLTHMHSIFYFIHQAAHISRGLGHSGTLDQRCNGKEGPKLLMEFRTACQQLEQALKQSHDKAASALASCTDFEVTPTLVYMTEYQYLIPSDCLSTTAGVTDVISTLRQHCYTVPVWFWRVPSTAGWSYGPFGSNRKFFRGTSEPHWRTQGTWRDLRISFASQNLKSIFTDGIETSIPHGGLEILEELFNESRGILDISSKEYFHSTSNLAILGVLGVINYFNLETALRSLCLRPSRLYLVLSTMFWINKHLTSEHVVMLLQGYDDTLQAKLAEVLRCIFKHLAGLPTFPNGGSTPIKFRPLPHGFYMESVTLTVNIFSTDNWELLHLALFGERGEKVNPSHWHPHLVSELLNVLVRVLYNRIYRQWDNVYDQSLPYIIRYLPHAHPTLENLDALRAIVYLYPQITSGWNPPEGLWPVLLELLKKYDRSILSSEEFNLFFKWMNSTEHATIKKYTSDADDPIAPSTLTRENTTNTGPTSHTADPSTSIPFEPTQPIQLSSLTALDQPHLESIPFEPMQPIQGALSSVTMLDQSELDIDSPTTSGGQKQRTPDVRIGVGGALNAVLVLIVLRLLKDPFNSEIQDALKFIGFIVLVLLLAALKKKKIKKA